MPFQRKLFNYFANDEMFGLPVLAGGAANDSSCAILRFNLTIGVIEGTGATVGDCVAQYYFITAAGSSNTATVTIHTSAPPT